MSAFVQRGQADKYVVIETNRKFYEALASSDNTWKTYPGYAHDSEFEHDRSQLDDDVVTWIHERAATASSVSLSQLT